MATIWSGPAHPRPLPSELPASSFNVATLVCRCSHGDRRHAIGRLTDPAWPCTACNCADFELWAVR